MINVHSKSLRRPKLILIVLLPNVLIGEPLAAKSFVSVLGELTSAVPCDCGIIETSAPVSMRKLFSYFLSLMKRRFDKFVPSSQISPSTRAISFPSYLVFGLIGVVD